MNWNLIKRALSLLLALVMLVGNVPAVAFATEETAEETVAETVAETAAPTVLVEEPETAEDPIPMTEPIPAKEPPFDWTPFFPADEPETAEPVAPVVEETAQVEEAPKAE